VAPRYDVGTGLAGIGVNSAPWVTLIAGCLTGTFILAILAYVDDTYHQAPSQSIVRLTFLPAIAGWHSSRVTPSAR
jgi:hypothetical protein